MTASFEEHKEGSASFTVWPITPLLLGEEKRVIDHGS